MSMQRSGDEALKRLEAAGVPVDRVPESQREVLRQLSPEELETLVRVNQRIKDAEPDVQGYLADVNGYVVF